MNDLLFSTIKGITSLHNKPILDQISLRKKLPLSRLIAIALEHELERERPFEYECDPPDDEYIPFSYATEAGLLLTYLGKSSGLPLDMLCLLREDIGIPDKSLFMLAFRECILTEAIESFTPLMPKYIKFQYDPDYVYYRIKGANKEANKKARKLANEYEELQRLKKKFKDE